MLPVAGTMLLKKVARAMPLLSVSVGVIANAPPRPTLLQATERPERADALPYMSTSWAVQATDAPATGIDVAGVTTYDAGGPADTLTISEPLELPSVASSVSVPAVVPTVSESEILPDASVIAVLDGLNVPPTPLAESDTLMPACATFAPLPSTSCAVTVRTSATLTVPGGDTLTT